MTATTHPRASLATRCGYRAGAFVRNARTRVVRFEASWIARVDAAHGSTGAVVAQSFFVLAKASAVATAFFITLWLTLSILLLLLTAYAWSLVAVEQTEHPDDGPDYLGATSYLGNYDDNGHWIGHILDWPYKGR